MTIDQISIYLRVIGMGIAVVVFYSYIVYLYRSEKLGKKDYEKYGNIALDDELDSIPVESVLESEHKTKE